MKNRIWVLVVMVVISLQVCCGEDNVVDSLKAQIEEKVGTEKVDLLIELSRNFVNSNPLESFEPLNRALDLSKSLNYKKGQILSYQFLGQAYQFTGRVDSAIFYYNNGFDLSLKSNKLDLGYTIVFSIGLCYGAIGDSQNAQKYLLTALDIADSLRKVNALSGTKKITLLKNLAWIYLKLGDLSIANNDYLSAMNYYSESLNYSKLSNDNRRRCSIYTMFSELYSQLKDTSKSVLYLDSALHLAYKYDEFSLGHLYFSRSGIEEKKGGLEKALLYLDSSAFYSKKYNEYIMLSYLKFSYGSIYIKQKEYEKAHKIIIEGIDELKQFNIGMLLAEGYYVLGKLYSLNGNIKEANYYLLMAKDIYKDQDNKEFYLLVLNLLSDNAAKANDFDNAYNYQLLIQETSRNFSDENLKIALQNIAIQNEREKQKNELELIKRENEVKEAEKNNQILAMSSVIVVLLLISLFAYYRYRLKKKHSDELQILINTKDKFFSIISHDLKGPLSSYNQLSKILIENFDTLSPNEIKTHLNNLEQSSGHIYNLLENLLTWSRMETKDLKAKPDTLEISKIIDEEIKRFKTDAEGKKISMNYSNGIGVCSFSDEFMTRSVLRNLLSNALKFTPENGNIDIKLKDADDKIEISVKDTGIGIKEDDKPYIFDIGQKISRRGTNNEKGTGLGLTLCKEFIELNNGNIHFQSETGKGTEFRFTLPKK